MYARRFGLQPHMMLGYSVVKVCRRTTDSTRTTDTRTTDKTGTVGTSGAWTTDTRTTDTRTRLTTGSMVDKELDSDDVISNDNSSSSSSSSDGDDYEWEVHYKKVNSWGNTNTNDDNNYNNNNENNNENQIFITYCHSVVVACGRAQIPVTDEGLKGALSGFSGPIINAKDVKDIKGEGSLCPD